LGIPFMGLCPRVRRLRIMTRKRKGVQEDALSNGVAVTTGLERIQILRDEERDFSLKLRATIDAGP
jgi:hypothetical protein